MTDKTIELDQRRGMEAQKATDLPGCLPRWKPTNAPCVFASRSWKRTLADAPAATWEEAAEKVRYVLGLYAATLTAKDTRRPEPCSRPCWRIWSACRRVVIRECDDRSGCHRAVAWRIHGPSLAPERWIHSSVRIPQISVTLCG